MVAQREEVSGQFVGYGASDRISCYSVSLRSYRVVGISF